MVNRERFMLDVDSEGFPQRYDDVPHPPATLAGLNVGRSADHAIVQALLADHKCLSCAPPEPQASWVEEARQFVSEADRAMDIGAKGDTIRSMNGITHLSMKPYAWEGVGRLSDSAAPDAYFGWKS